MNVRVADIQDGVPHPAVANNPRRNAARLPSMFADPARSRSSSVKVSSASAHAEGLGLSVESSVSLGRGTEPRVQPVAVSLRLQEEPAGTKGVVIQIGLHPAGAPVGETEHDIRKARAEPGVSS